MIAPIIPKDAPFNALGFCLLDTILLKGTHRYFKSSGMTTEQTAPVSIKKLTALISFSPSYRFSMIGKFSCNLGSTDSFSLETYLMENLEVFDCQIPCRFICEVEFIDLSS